MKKALTVLSLVVFCGCDGSNEIDNSVYVKPPLYKIVIIDSCEYLATQSYNSQTALTHKGNCKFCKERNNKK